MASEKYPQQTFDEFPPVPQDEVTLTLKRDWTPEEEARAKRKWVDHASFCGEKRIADVCPQAGFHHHADSHPGLLLSP